MGKVSIIGLGHIGMNILFRPPLLLRNMARAGWWGKDYGRGFYQYPEEKKILGLGGFK